MADVFDPSKLTKDIIIAAKHSLFYRSIFQVFLLRGWNIFRRRRSWWMVVQSWWHGGRRVWAMQRRIIRLIQIVLWWFMVDLGNIPRDDEVKKWETIRIVFVWWMSVFVCWWFRGLVWESIMPRDEWELSLMGVEEYALIMLVIGFNTMVYLIHKSCCCWIAVDMIETNHIRL